MPISQCPPNMTEEQYARREELYRKFEAGDLVIPEERDELRDLNRLSISHLQIVTPRTQRS